MNLRGKSIGELVHVLGPGLAGLVVREDLGLVDLENLLAGANLALGVAALEVHGVLLKRVVIGEDGGCLGTGAGREREESESLAVHFGERVSSFDV